MKCEILYYNREIQAWIEALPISIKASYVHLANLLKEFGADLRLPHSRAMGKGLFELRPKGREGIARIFYCTQAGRQIYILHGFIKKTEKTPRKELDIAINRMREVKGGYKK